MVVEKGKEEERNEGYSLICDYFTHPSIERERRLLDEKRVKWNARRMEMITTETKEMFQGKIGVEYRLDKQVVGKKPPIKSPEEILERMLCWERYFMELLLLYEVNKWEQLSGTNVKHFWTRLAVIEWKREKD